jgi:hypothetical protein
MQDGERPIFQTISGIASTCSASQICACTGARTEAAIFHVAHSKS